MRQKYKETIVHVGLGSLLLLLASQGHAATPFMPWSQYEKICKDAIHIQCIRQGIKRLARKGIPDSQKSQVYGYLAAAYLAINQRPDAEKALVRMVELDPCRDQPPPTLPPTMTRLYRATRRKVLHQDQTPPAISHQPLSLQQFRTSGLFQATITENLKLRQTTLYYRLSTSGPYTSIPLRQSAPNKFEARIGVRIRQRARHFQYYLEAIDCARHVGKAQAANQRPFEIVMQLKASSGRVVAGAVLIVLGSGLLVTSPLTFLSANSELERWKATNDITRSEAIRSHIILLHGLGWSGLGLGLTLGVIGTYLVLTQPRKVAPTVRQLSLYPNEADHATMVRVPHFYDRSPTPAPQ